MLWILKSINKVSTHNFRYIGKWVIGRVDDTSGLSLAENPLITFSATDVCSHVLFNEV